MGRNAVYLRTIWKAGVAGPWYPTESMKGIKSERQAGASSRRSHETLGQCLLATRGTGELATKGFSRKRGQWGDLPALLNVALLATEERVCRKGQNWRRCPSFLPAVR